VRNKLIAGLTGAAAAIAAVSFAPSAQASYGAYITSTITRTGKPCIDVNSPDLNNRYIHTRGTICGGVSRVSYWAEPGQ
jgi:hypothetical protein